MYKDVTIIFIAAFRPFLLLLLLLPTFAKRKKGEAEKYVFPTDGSLSLSLSTQKAPLGVFVL